MIKKLQNNFTTPEQSKRLLELGVPAGSADMYYHLENHQYYVRYGFSVKQHDFFEFYKNIFYPCWSAGRLIELFIICTPYVEIRLRTRLIEQLVASYEDVIKQGMIDFSKLEE